MKKEMVFFPEWVVLDYLGKNKNLQSTDNIELLGAVIILKFCERQFGKECLVGLEVKEKYKNKIPKKGDLSEREFDFLIKKQLEKDTPIDFSIGIPSIEKRMDFQLKRFGKSPKQNTTEDLVGYVERLSRKYGDTNCSLITLCESCKVSPLEISNGINKIKHPFEKIILLAVEGSNYIYYHGVWSKTGETGTSKFNVNKMEFEY